MIGKTAKKYLYVGNFIKILAKCLKGIIKSINFAAVNEPLS